MDKKKFMEFLERYHAQLEEEVETERLSETPDAEAIASMYGEMTAIELICSEIDENL